MRRTRLTSSKYLCGMAASLAIGLCGGWLILAPFALGYQPSGADWVSQTTNDVVTGISVAIVALIGLLLFFSSLLSALRDTGVLAARTRPQAQAAFQSQISMALVPATTQSDLDHTLATLAAALAADLNARREIDSKQVGDQVRQGGKHNAER
jgi:hypothetical protein